MCYEFLDLEFYFILIILFDEVDLTYLHPISYLFCAKISLKFPV